MPDNNLVIRSYDHHAVNEETEAQREDLDD